MAFDLTNAELRIFQRLRTPQRIQDFLDDLKINFEESGDTCWSPRKVLQERKAHCMEGEMLAAAALRLHGYRPLVIDLRATADDFDHVVAVFQQHGHWGALSKTNHAVLRYREPVYRNIRELAMSYFHEYFDDNGKKNLREYSRPIDLSRFDRISWMTTGADVWEIPEYLDCAKHFTILNHRQHAMLRRAHPIEIKAGKLVEWKGKLRKL
ncbi:MAG TPA: hypothetical protein VJK52_02735 [Candidatus Nanoarchaeia archaeon]|nr:hypothetical protein [Candidatus Nanoarchaeia archaeon]